MVNPVVNPVINPCAGEAELVLNGVAHRCRLTLGSLAEAEAGLPPDGLIGLISRFETGHYSAADLLAVLLAGLRGAGWTGTRQDLAGAEVGGGLRAAVAVAGQLLARAFAPPGG